MATKKTHKSTRNKKTTAKTPRKASGTSIVAAKVTDTNKTLLQRIKTMRLQRTERKADRAKRKQTDKARKVKAQQRAIRENALEQVQKAVVESKRRRSRPGLTLFLALVLAVLGGFAMYQYRQIEINDKVVEISELKSNAMSFQELQATIQANKQAELDKHTTVTLEDGATILVPREWTTKDTSLPLEEQKLGDDNVTISIVSSESRNSTAQYIPIVDYIWTIAPSKDGDSLQVTAQSMHCERFDTLSNDLHQARREHLGFSVFCDTDTERVEIAVLATPEQYGTTLDNTYFLISVIDLQQVDFNDIVRYIESYTR
jgi:hypothetical protein